MEQLDSSGGVISNARWDSPYMTGTCDWTQIAQTFTAASNAAKVRFYLFANGTGHVWFDDAAIG